MIDIYTYGQVDRISPEAPVPVLQVSHETRTLGGAGNVARNLNAVGAQTEFISVVGPDEGGTIAQELLSQLPNVKAILLTDHSRSTTIKTRYVSGNNQLIRADRETSTPIDEVLMERVYQQIAENISHIDLILLSDYKKGVLAPDLVKKIIKLARQHHKAVIIDPKGSNYSHYSGATIITPNLKELQQSTQLPCNNPEQIVEAARYLHQSLDLDHIIVTCGKDGIILVPRTEKEHSVMAQAREVFDVSGAGDTVISYLAAAYPHTNNNLRDVVSLANAAAGIAVGKIGTATVSSEEIISQLQEVFPQFTDKIMSPSSLCELMSYWRALHKSIGFTNGCFDLLHSGHLFLLQQAKNQCNRLVVAVNSDSSIKRLKGPQRPIHDEHNRLQVLASLAMVDAVIVFDDDTPERLIKEIRPDVLIKGQDYTIDKVVGASFVQSYGGRVFLASLKPDHSTTITVKKIARNNN